MEKIRKKRPNGWTKAAIVVILCTLNFSGNLCLGQADAPKEIKPTGVDDVKSGESLELREAKVFRESTENQLLELELEKEKLSADYKKLRSRYAELYVSTHNAVKRLRELELRAVNLIQTGETGIDSGKIPGMANPDELNGAGREALEALELVLSKQIELQDTLSKFKEYFTATLDVLQPSESVKTELMKRLDDLQNAVDNSARPLRIAAMAGNENRSRNCGVLSVNDELELVILDKGTLAGVRPGGRWRQVGRDGGVEARLVVVEARAEISAAVMLEGELSSLRAGNILEREENTRSEKPAASVNGK